MMPVNPNKCLISGCEKTRYKDPTKTDPEPGCSKYHSRLFMQGQNLSIIRQPFQNSFNALPQQQYFSSPMTAVSPQSPPPPSFNPTMNATAPSASSSSVTAASYQSPQSPATNQWWVTQATYQLPPFNPNISVTASSASTTAPKEDNLCSKIADYIASFFSCANSKGNGAKKTN